MTDNSGSSRRRARGTAAPTDKTGELPANRRRSSWHPGKSRQATDKRPANDRVNDQPTTGEQLENQLKQAVIGKYSRQSSRPTTGQRSAKDRPMTGGQPAKQGDKTDEGPVVRRAPRLFCLLPGFSGSFRASWVPSISPGPGFRVLPGSRHLPAPGTFRLPASGTRHPPVLFGTFRPRHPPAFSGTLGPGAFRPSSAPSGASRACRPFPLRPAAYSHFLKRKKRIVSAEQSTMSASAKR